VSVDLEIAKVLDAKADAIVRRAADRLDSLIHTDFVYVNAAGRSFDKAGYIEFFCTSGKIVFEEQRVSELSVQAYPGTAVATFIAHDRYLTSGQTIDATYQSMCVFVDGPMGWQWVAGQTKTSG
jgi:hypothetical protein